MCGISVAFLKKPEDSFGEKFSQMNNVICYRGPDDEGYLLLNKSDGFSMYTGKDSVDLSSVSHKNPITQVRNSEDITAALGFRRLSILDLSSAGHQPMIYMNRYSIVFNGEIYNYRELKSELKTFGYSFKSETDTEVIMAAYDKWGADCLNKFNGMWAFVLLDKKMSEAFVSRDRYGIKPMYYYQDSDRLMFASEIKQFIAYGNLKIEPDIQKIKSGLRFDSKEFTHETQFTNVFRFPNANFLKFNYKDSFKDLNFKKYYSLFVNYDENLEEYSDKSASKFSEEYYSLLTDSVKLRLRSDVNVGTCFSGGLDSSSIVYVVNKLLESEDRLNKQKTFSLVFTSEETKECDESRYIDSLTRELELESYMTEPDVQDVISEYENMVFVMDTPQHSSLMSYIFTYQLVKKHGVTVTLDGQGADELQAGYFHYFMNYFSNVGASKILKEKSKYKSNPGSEAYINRGIAFNLIRKFGLSNIVRHYLKNKGFEKNPWASLNKQLEQDFNENLQSLFHYGDRGSMNSSVESRFPMMDYRLVDFWMKLPIAYKLNDGYTKYIARLTFDKKLPDDIVWRRQKFGWEMPQKYWLENGLGEFVINEIRDSKFLMEYDIIDNAEKFYDLNIKTNNLKQIFRILNLAIWHRIYFERKLENFIQ